MTTTSLSGQKRQNDGTPVKIVRVNPGGISIAPKKIAPAPSSMSTVSPASTSSVASTIVVDAADESQLSKEIAKKKIEETMRSIEETRQQLQKQEEMLLKLTKLVESEAASKN